MFLYKNEIKISLKRKKKKKRKAHEITKLRHLLYLFFKRRLMNRLNQHYRKCLWNYGNVSVLESYTTNWNESVTFDTFNAWKEIKSVYQLFRISNIFDLCSWPSKLQLITFSTYTCFKYNDWQTIWGIVCELDNSKNKQECFNFTDWRNTLARISQNIR